jgi:hypothetical protein
LPAVVALCLAAPLGAQQIIGLGADAVTIPRGVFRFGLAAEHTLQRDRWADGVLEGLGAPFSGDALGPDKLTLLGPLQQLVRDLGVPDFAASLGAPRLELRQRVFVTPLSLEYGVTDWLTLGVNAPLVRAKSEGLFRVKGDSGRATLGLNPLYAGSAVPAGNRATIDRYSAASTSLAQRRADCQSNPGAYPECPTILAELSTVDALISGTTQFATGLATVYGGSGLTGGRPFVPMAGSAAELALLARVDSLRTAFTRYGVGDITPTTGLPLGAQAPLGTADVAALIADSTNGYGARPLSGSAITGFGDMHVTAKLKLFDSFGAASDSRFAAARFGVRQAVTVDARLGTGIRPAPGDLLDQGTGSGSSALTLRSTTDLVLTARLWTSLSIAMTQGTRSTERLRVPSAPGAALLESWREADVAVTPGRLLDASFAPRWQLNDYIALGASWRWRKKSADAYAIDSTVTDPFGDPVTLAGSALAATSAFDVQQFGWSATFSTLAARSRGRPGLAFEVNYSHEQAIASGAGIVPKTWFDRLEIRYYTRLFGR